MHLSLLSAGLGSAAAASAEAGLQAVNEVADDGEDEQEDDDNDRDDDVAGHFGDWWWEVGWVELLTGLEARVWNRGLVLVLYWTSVLAKSIVIQRELVSLVVVVAGG